MEQAGWCVVGLLVLDVEWVTQLSVDPSDRRQGLGTRCSGAAKERSPDGLDLWTFELHVGSQPPGTSRCRPVDSAYVVLDGGCCSSPKESPQSSTAYWTMAGVRVCEVSMASCVPCGVLNTMLRLKSTVLR